MAAQGGKSRYFFGGDGGRECGEVAEADIKTSLVSSSIFVYLASSLHLTYLEIEAHSYSYHLGMHRDEP